MGREPQSVPENLTVPLRHGTSVVGRPEPLEVDQIHSLGAEDGTSLGTSDDTATNFEGPLGAG